MSRSEVYAPHYAPHHSGLEEDSPIKNEATGDLDFEMLVEQQDDMGSHLVAKEPSLETFAAAMSVV